MKGLGFVLMLSIMACCGSMGNGRPCMPQKNDVESYRFSSRLEFWVDSFLQVSPQYSYYAVYIDRETPRSANIFFLSYDTLDIHKIPLQLTEACPLVRVKRGKRWVDVYLGAELYVQWDDTMWCRQKRNFDGDNAGTDFYAWALCVRGDSIVKAEIDPMQVQYIWPFSMVHPSNKIIFTAPKF